MNITVLDLSAYIGLTAVGAITINMLLGVMMAFRYSPVRNWPHHRPQQIAKISRPRHRLPRPLPAATARKHHRCHRALHGRPHGHHFLLSHSARPPHLESLPLLRLPWRRRPLLALPLHRPRPKRCPHRLVRRRQALRRSLRRHHSRNQPPPRPPLPKKGSPLQTNFPPVHHVLLDFVGSFAIFDG
jgi:hypothetical protein